MSELLKKSFVLLLYLIVSVSNAQTNFSSESELKKHAEQLFFDEKYTEATPLYAQLVSNYSKDVDLNYRLGVCMLFSSDNKEKNLPFLEFAAHKAGVEKKVHFYLGKAYHLNYMFDDAIEEYRKYIKLASSKSVKELDVHRLIEMCANGKKLLKNLKDLVVKEKKEMKREDFFRSYDVSQIGGRLLVKPDEKEFKTSLDRKKKEQSIIYLAKDKSQIYFSSYGSDEGNGKDIYFIKRAQTGDWGELQKISGPINTKYDDDYPFLHPNGKVLYFSSKGHNSMGGYDIFKSLYNETSKQWGEPINMDFPVNTPDDDILYVTDSAEKEAYFSSARASISGQISVYHINVERKPINVIVVKGNVIKNRDEQSLASKITVKDLANNSILGIYYASPKDGAYNFEIPNGGSFSFSVESSGFSTQSDMVIVPVQSDFKPMQQKITYELETDKMKIESSYGEPGGGENYLLALNYIKNKSKLDVSPVEDTPVATAEGVSGDAAISEKEPEAGESDADIYSAELSSNDIVNIATNDAEELDEEAKEMREHADIALLFANEKSELAESKSQEAANYIAEAANTDDVAKKEEYFDLAEDAETESKLLNQQTVTAFNLAKKLDKKAVNKSEEANLSALYAASLDSAVNSDNPEAAMALLEEQETLLDELSKANEGTATIYDNLKSDAESKERQLDFAVQSSKDITQEIADNKTMIKTLKLDLEEEKKDDVKKGMLNEIAELENDNVVKAAELVKYDAQVIKLKKAYDGLLNEAEMVHSVIDKSSTESEESISKSIASVDKDKLEEAVNEIAIEDEEAEETVEEVEPESTLIASTHSVNNESTDGEENLQSSNESSSATDTEDRADDSIIVEDDLVINAEDVTDEEGEQLADNTQVNNTAGDEEPRVESYNYDEGEVASGDSETVNNDDQADETLEVAAAEAEEAEEKEVAAAAAAEITSTNDDEEPSDVSDNSQYDIQSDNVASGESDGEDSNSTSVELAETTIVSDTPIPDVNQELVENSVNENADSVEPNDETTAVNDELTNENVEEEDLLDVGSAKTVEKVELVVSGDSSESSEQDIPDVQSVDDEVDVTLVNVDSGASDTKANLDVDTSVGNTEPNSDLVESVEAEEQSDSNVSIASSSEENTDEVNEVVDNNTNQTSAASSKISNESTEDDNIVVEVVENSSSQNNTTGNDAVFTTYNNKDEDFVSINKKHQEAYAEAEKIDNEIDREKKKSRILQTWSNDIDAYLARKKNVFDETDNPEEKIILADKISEALASSKEKQRMADESVATVKVMEDNSSASAEKSGEVAISTGNDTDEKLEMINSENARDLAIVDNIENDYDREKAKASVLKIWTEEVDVHVENLEDDYLNEDNTSQKEIIAKQIEAAKSTIVGEYTPSYETLEVEAETPNQSSRLLAGDIYVLNSSPMYSADQPIPINAESPEGLVYKVQIGAFRNPIPQDLFVGISPINGETTPQGFIRYTAGIFRHLPSANKIKDEIRGLGYKDAFVVAFNNGKRVSIQQANKIAGNSNSNNSNSNNSNNSSSQDGFSSPLVDRGGVKIINAEELQKLYTDISSRGNGNETTSSSLNNNSNANASLSASTENYKTSNTINSSVSNNNATSGERLGEGVYYTVQVGVFSKRVSPNKLANIQPLYTQSTSNGYLRYNAGIYSSLGQANTAKEMAVDMGIADAYVTAYNNGKRVSLSEAKRLASSGNVISKSIPNINQLPTFNRKVKAKVTTLQSKPVSEQKIYASSFSADVVYKVQLGVYQYEVPIEIVNKFLTISDLGIENYKDEKGYTIFTAGGFSDYDTANKLKVKLKARNFTDVFVVAYRDGKKIPLEGLGN